METDAIEKTIGNYFAALIHAHQEHERLPALLEIAPDLDDTDFWFLFAQVWANSPMLYPHQAVIRDLFTPDRLNAPERVGMNSDEEQATWRERIRRHRQSGRGLKVYRGGETRNLTGFAWTTDRKRAETFARLTCTRNPQLVIGRLHPGQIVMPFNERGEHGVCAFPEHVAVERIENVEALPVPQAERLAQTIKRSTNIPVELYASMVRERSAEKDIAIGRTLEFFTEQARVLRALGFTKRPTFLDAVAAKVQEDEPMAAAA